MSNHIYIIGITAMSEDSYNSMTPVIGRTHQEKMFVMPEGVRGDAPAVAAYAFEQVRRLERRLDGASTDDLVPPACEGVERLCDLLITPSQVTRAPAPYKWKTYAEWAGANRDTSAREAFEAGRASVK